MSQHLPHEAQTENLPAVRYADSACHRFELAWRTGPRPRIEDFLADTREPQRVALLRELVPLDAAFRRLQGETPTPTEYRQRFPILEADWLARTLERAEPDQAGRYRLEGELGRGGMGIIYRAHDPDLQRGLAVKVLLPEHAGDAALEHRFLEEAQLMGQLQHPGVAPVHEIGRLPDGRPFFAMKLIKGHTLAELLGQRLESAADLPRFVAIFGQVCQTLAYAHSRRVIHRDLKPANVMVGAFGEVQVMDWGLAKVLPHAAGEGAPAEEAAPPASFIRTVRSTGHGANTQTGQVVGTPAYMPPEQANGLAAQTDERADVFGLGAMLCEVLTGKPPYVAPTSGDALLLAAMADQVDAQARLDRCGADAELVALARACLAARREARPRDAGAVAETIAAYQAGVETRLRQAEVERAGAEVRAKEERKRRRLAVLLAAAVLGLVVLGGGGAWWVRSLRVDADREAEQAYREAQVLYEQARTASVHDRAPWTKAEEATKRAAGLAAAGLVSAPLREEVQALRQQVEGEAAQIHRHRQMLDRLVDIRTHKEDEFSRSDISVDYARAFREYGMDVEDLPPEEAAARLRQLPAEVRLELLAALDDWVLELRRQRQREGGWRRLLEIAQQAEDDAGRRELRGLLGSPDLAAVRRVTDGARPADLPSPSVLLLALVLNEVGDRERALEVLRAALVRQPGEVWLNYTLATYLEQSDPPRREEAIRYYTAARAVRAEIGHALAHALAKAGRREEAVSVFRELTRLRPDHGRHHNCLGGALQASGDLPGAVVAYHKAIDLAPKFAPAPNNLGLALHDAGDLPGAVAAYRKAIELDPKYAEAHYNLGLALHASGDLPGAVAAWRKAIDLDAKFAMAHNNLGAALRDAGDLPGAVAAYRKAIELNPKYAKAHNNLGLALRASGDLPGAVAAWRKAIDLDPKDAPAHYNLGNALRATGDLPGAVAAHRKAIELRPGYAEAHCNLGHALRDQGQLPEALAALKQGHQLGSQQTNWRYPSARWVKECARLVELDKRLPDVLQGKVKPANAAEHLEYARLCRLKKLYQAATGFHADALTAEASLADDPKAGNRYNAALCAALAAASKGEDAAQLNDAERARLRQQARDWLRADLAAWRKLAEDQQTRPEAQKVLKRWQQDADLTSVRDQESLAKLPGAERQAWQQFWADVDDLLKQVASPPW